MFNMKMAWLSWLGVVVARLHRGDVDGAAHYLACCIEIPDSAEDVAGQRRMFTHPNVRMNASALWERMRPEITEECAGDVKRQLVNYGWEL